MQGWLVGTRIVVLIAGLSVCSGCASTLFDDDKPIPPREVRLDDKVGLIPSGRVSYEIMPGIETRRRGSMLDLVTGQASIRGKREDGEEVDPVRFTLNVAGEFSQIKGRDDVGVPADRRIELGRELSGPARAVGRARSSRGHVTVRPGGRFYDVLSVEAIIGAGFDVTELRLRSAGFDARQQQAGGGFVMGTRVGLRPIPLLDLYGQVIMMLGIPSVSDFEVGAQLNLTPNVGVYGGFRHSSFAWFEFQGDGSDVDADFEGPTIGASLAF